MSTIPRRIRELRKRLGLTQGDFAARLQVSQTSVSRWEKGTQEPDLTTMMDIGRLAGLDPIQFALNHNEHDFGFEIENKYTNIVGEISDEKHYDLPRWHKDDHVRLAIPIDLPEGHFLEAYLIGDTYYEPRYTKGTIVFVALYQKNRDFYPKNGDTCLCFHKTDKDLWRNSLKHFRWERGGRIILSSLDQNPFDEIDLDESVITGNPFYINVRAQHIMIIGVVIAQFLDENSARLPVLAPEEAELG